MAAIRDVVHRVPWTRQPQFPVPIDWGNPITRGLQVAMLPASRPVDLAGNNLLTYDTGVTYQDDPNGRGFLFDGATNGISTVGIAPSAYTMFGLVNQNALGAAKGVISIGSGSAYTGQLRADSADWSYYHSTAGGGTDILASDPGTVVVGKLTAIAGTWDGLNGIKLYRAGVLRASSTVITGRPVSYLKVGLQWAGSIYVALLWSRALTAIEHVSLAANPWQVFLGQSRRIWTPTATGIPTLSASTFKPATLTSTGWTPRVTAT